MKTVSRYAIIEAENKINSISERDEARSLVDDDCYRIVGLPFFVKKTLRGL
ncbi:hypothetical protein [Streptococcus iniae]|uniref:hypothetical protein n=1 Tax=Streptococcus iniae TaxID=1346 RepID=UPI0002F0E8C6|nr:hypothetical protein [Streptococcus iniae]AGM98140.1 hypothetical protein K710_0338 [Streptococcus iniae SF1]